MRQLTILLVFLFITTNTFSQVKHVNEQEFYSLKIAENIDGEPVVISHSNLIIAKLEELDLDLGRIVHDISTSDMEDRKLIVKVIEMQSSYEKNIEDIINMSYTYETMTEILLREVHHQLADQYTEEELENLKK